MNEKYKSTDYKPQQEITEVLEQGDLHSIIKEHINLQRLQILEETEVVYIVELDGQEFIIAKDSETYFVPEEITASGIEIKLKQLPVILPDTNIFQDETVRSDFKEVMMFHEIREQEYKEAHFEDIHQRAINDEILYVMRYFAPNLQKEYFKFADEYREQKKQAEMKQKEHKKEEKDSIHERILDDKLINRLVRAMAYYQEGDWPEWALEIAGLEGQNPTEEEWLEAVFSLYKVKGNYKEDFNFWLNLYQFWGDKDASTYDQNFYQIAIKKLKSLQKIIEARG